MIDKLLKEYNIKVNINVSPGADVNTNSFDNVSSLNDFSAGNKVINIAKLIFRKKISSQLMVNTDDNNYFRCIHCNNDLFINLIYFN